MFRSLHQVLFIINVLAKFKELKKKRKNWSVYKEFWKVLLGLMKLEAKKRKLKNDTKKWTKDKKKKKNNSRTKVE